MSFMEKHRFAISPTQQALLKMAWEGAIFGTAMCEAMAEKFPEYAKELTAGATMEWYNVHYCEEFGHDLGVHVSLAEAEAIGQAGTRFFQSHTFETAARVTMAETPAADVLYAQLGHGAGGTPELKALGEDLVEHENALRDFLKSVLDGKPDGGAKIFAYLERKGITREEAVTPRKVREGWGGETQSLVLAFFANEDAADKAAAAIKSWDKATEHMKFDAVGVLVKDSNGSIRQHKLGKRAGKRGMGVGVVLGLIAAIPTGGLSLVGGVLGGALGGGVIGEFFHRGLKISENDAARIGRELDAGRAAVGVLAWDSETDILANKLKDLGGTPQTHAVTKLSASAAGTV